MANTTYDIIDYTNKLNNTFAKDVNFAPIEPSTTSTNAYVVGEKFMLNGTLYRATANIAVGATIVPGTEGATGVNATATTVADEMQRIVQTTTTDPGEGSTLATNCLLFVIEE